MFASFLTPWIVLNRRYLVLAVLAISIAGTLAWANTPDQASLPEQVVADQVVVDKSDRTLSLMRGGQVLKRYRVSFGASPRGHKEREGDERTPEGRYIIDRRLERSAFYRALHVSYPDSAAIARARRLGVSPGGDIMVHGIRNGAGWAGKLQRLVNWTDGCIALTNWEMAEVWRAVPNGTPIEIRP